MALPPSNPDRTAAGIVVDPLTLERVVPTSHRKDGSVRKELKIRPGFTPQEDVGRFRGSRQQASDAGRPNIPGSTRSRPPPENPFATAGGSKTKSQMKNEKRREKKKAGGISNKAWDESDDESDDQDIGEAFKAEAESRKAAVNGQSGSVQEEQKSKQDEDDKPAWPVEDGGQGMISEGGPDGGGVPDEPIPIEPAVDEKKDNDEGETAILSPPPPGPRQRDPAAPSANPSPTPSTPEWRAASSRKPKSNKPHPIQGGRQGPIGLAHPPPIEQSSKSTRPPRQKKPSQTGESGRKPSVPAGSTEQSKANTKAEPRVRKEVKVRDTGLGSLADRVKNLVIANQEPEKKEKKDRPAVKNEPAAAA